MTEVLLTYYQNVINKQSSKLKQNNVQLDFPVDNRIKLEVINEFMLDGINAVPNYLPSFMINSNGFKTDKGNLFPLSGISNTTIVNCNQNGYWSIYESDKYGFNNLKDFYSEDVVDILLIGDSFIEGYCVKPNETIGAHLISSGLSVISMGKGGNGPLSEYATFKEYGLSIKPKVLLWEFFPNDLGNLIDEMNSDLLMNYIYDESFTQNLTNRQNEVDSLVLDYLDKRVLEEALTNKYNENVFFKLLKLSTIRSTILSIQKRKNEISPSNLNDFRLILNNVKKLVNSYNGKLYFVYFPYIDRHSMDMEDYDYYQKVLNTVRELDIPIIDIRKEVFNEHSRRASLISTVKGNHYNEKGYRLIAEKISQIVSEK